MKKFKILFVFIFLCAFASSNSLDTSLEKFENLVAKNFHKACFTLAFYLAAKGCWDIYQAKNVDIEPQVDQFKEISDLAVQRTLTSFEILKALALKKIPLFNSFLSKYDLALKVAMSKYNSAFKIGEGTSKLIAALVLIRLGYRHKAAYRAKLVKS